jgi:hypothetical protein
MESTQRPYETFDATERSAFASSCMIHGYREIDFLVFDHDVGGRRRVEVQKGMVSRFYDGDDWLLPFTADLEGGAFDGG